MAEDKAEGEVRKTSGSSSVAEGDFHSGKEQQLDSIEVQLRRAQATLFDLQNLKARLEAERKENRLKEREEQELLAAKKIKQENEKLRDELKGYQGEINSLKDIIGSLKDDLVRTAERLSDKVEISLRAIGETDEVSHRASSGHRVVHHKAKPEEPKEHNFFNDHLDNIAKTETKNQHIRQEEKEDIDIKEQEPVKPEVRAEIVPEVKKQEIPAVTPTPPPVQPTAAPIQRPQVAAPVAPAATADPIPAEPDDIAKTSGEQFLQQVETEIEAETDTNTAKPAIQEQEVDPLDDEDLLEFEAIRRELVTLEEEHIFKPTSVSEEPQPAKQEEAKSEKAKKGLFSFLNKDSKSKKAATDKALPEQSPLKDHEQYKAHFWGKKEQAAKPAEAAQASVPPTPAVAEQPKAEVKDEAVHQAVEVLNNSPAAVPEATPAIPEPVPQPAEEPKIAEAQPQPVAMATPEAVAVEPETKPAVQAEASPKPISKLGNVFKKRKKKIIGDVDDRSEDHKPRGTAGTGKLAIGAAVFVLLVASGGIAYRISNADQLRQMYTSKAKENVESAKVKQVPDGFTEIDPELKYKEAYMDAPFADTIWTTYKDPDLGIVLDYPQNTSYRLKPVGSTNLWFLRKNGYLLKIEKIVTDQTLQQYAEGITNGIKYAVESVNVRNHETIHMVLQEDLPVKGNVYAVKMEGNVIYKIWYKTFLPDESPDDEQRVTKMLDTLDFITPEN